MSPGASEQHNREKFLSLASPHLNRLNEYVRHQLAYFESVGDLLPGDLSSEDVVDAVLLRAYGEFVNDSADREIRSWLIQLATEQLRAEIKRLKSERENTVHIEEDIPETPPAEEVVTLGEEILEFYQPDEDLKLEDIFPEVDISTPEEWVGAKEELLRCINAALGGMPEEWRRALRLRHTEGLTYEELAEVFDKAEPEIERILEYARQHLRQSLTESGCTFIVKGSKKQARSARRKGERKASVKGRKENG